MTFQTFLVFPLIPRHRDEVVYPTLPFGGGKTSLIPLTSCSSSLFYFKCQETSVSFTWLFLCWAGALCSSTFSYLNILSCILWDVGLTSRHFFLIFMDTVLSLSTVIYWWGHLYVSSTELVCLWSDVDDAYSKIITFYSEYCSNSYFSTGSDIF